MKSKNEIKGVYASVDFLVEVEENKDIVVLQLTDTQIIDSAQKRYEEPYRQNYHG